MKKFLLFIPLMLLSIALSACGSSNEETNTPGVPEQPGTNPSEPGTGNEHYLIVYCSRTNNTEHVAKVIQQSLDCDILEVEPQTAYDEDYNSMLNRAQSELAAIKQGNFYKDWSYSDDLIKIGHIDGNGIEALQVDGDVKVKLEK